MPAVTANPAPEAPAVPPQPGRPAGLVTREVGEAVQRARRRFQDTYGNHQGSTVISGTSALDEAVVPLVVLDSHGNGKSDGYRGVADAQTMVELAALPKYGEPGYGGRRAMREVQQRAAARDSAEHQHRDLDEKTKAYRAVTDAVRGAVEASERPL